MATEEHVVTLLTCFMSTGHASVRMADGRERLLNHATGDYRHLEGRTGTAVIDGETLIEFRPHPN